MPKLFTEEFKAAKRALGEWRLDNPDSDLTWETVEEFCIARILWYETIEDEAEPFLLSTRAAYCFARMEYYRDRLPVCLVAELTRGTA